MCVFVGVQLNRQFAVKLGEEVLLHLNHACNEHVLGCGQDLVDHEGLFLCDRCFRVLTQKLISKSGRSLINLLLTSLMFQLFACLFLLEIVIRLRLIISAVTCSHLLFHLDTSLVEHLLLHL